MNIQVASLVWACALSLIASEALLTFGVVAQTAAVTMDGASSGSGSSGGAAGGPVKSAPVLSPSEQDPAVRSAKSIECAQKADARGLLGKPRKRFLHECKSGA